MNTNLTHQKQNNLYGLTETFDDISKMYNEGNLPNKILLSGAKGIGKSTLAHHIINFIFSKGEENKYDVNKHSINILNKSFNLTTNNTHPNFYRVDLAIDKKFIEISQIRNMINYTNKSSFNNKEKIILLDNLEYLNNNSINALLKIIEEPNDNIFFILILDNNKDVLSTLKSRCLKFNLFLSNKKSIEVTNKIINDNIIDLINIDLLNYYNSPGDYINLLMFANSINLDLKNINLKNFLILLIDNNYYKKDIYIKKSIYRFIELYLSKIIHNKNTVIINNFYTYVVNKVSNINKYNLDQESFFLEFKSTLLNE
jgi:DNA polymerase-3 subunit delta'